MNSFHFPGQTHTACFCLYNSNCAALKFGSGVTKQMYFHVHVFGSLVCPYCAWTRPEGISTLDICPDITVCNVGQGGVIYTISCTQINRSE